MDWIIARLKEPSTYRGLGILLALAGLHPDPTSLATVGAGIVALVEIIKRERS